MKTIIVSLKKWFFKGLARKEDLDVLYNQLHGLVQIHRAMEGRGVLRPMRGWAFSPDAMTYILAAMQCQEKPRVIEFGSGQSTIVLAAALKHRGGQLISVEHDNDYLKGIHSQASACGLASSIQFVHSPLTAQTNGVSSLSYDLTTIPSGRFDFCIVDGPPITNGPLTRLAPLRWSLQNLKPNGTVFLDDARRGAERDCLDALTKEFPSLQVIQRSCEKGLAELRL